jgi:putative transcriptional regulator
MTITVNLDVMLARRKKSSRELAAAIGISEVNLSLIKNGHVKGMRFETLNRICKELDCAPGDILGYEPDP